ncbi:hypothetical protein [Bosea sp. (in: a-proteobacteria)]|uniref:hypothetical protein n=1 Tax=Bosea sp. (in: a-proteobacteria) TaxID=1871050 RepID=UPI00262EE75B|nr:hypothetical protein [Bosea sp. (in: a-proteobacteria)]MCO5091997.1 hypothetical protein [Bosea sp. (in: a-proteobacteria)]
MPNRLGRAVGAISPFNPKGALPDGLPDVQRGAGQEGEALFRVGSDLAGVFGHMADRAAAAEGKREGAIAGNDPAFRPTGSASIKGRAFDEAATSTYLDSLDAKLRQRMLDAYQTNKGDPAALTGAFDALKKDILDNDAFPEIRGQVSASFERLRLPFQVKALDALETRVQDQARAAAWEGNRASTGIAVAQVQAAPDSPQALANARRELDEAERRDKRLFESGAITAEQAAKNKAQRERAVEGARWGAKIANLPTEAEAAAAHEDFRRKAAAGDLGPVGRDADLMVDIDAAFRKRINTIRTDGVRALNASDGIAKDLLARLERGQTPPAAEVAAFREATAALPDGQSRLDRFDRRKRWLTMANAEGPEMLDVVGRQLRAVAGAEPSRTASEDMLWLQERAAGMRKRIAENPISNARALGLAALPPLRLDQPLALEQSLRERVASADALPAHLNPDRKVLEEEEARDITRKIGMGGETAVATVQAIVSAAGPAAPRVLRDIGGIAPDLAHAGLLLAGGGSKQAAREIIAGRQIIEAAKSGEGVAKPLGVDQVSFRTAFESVVGTTMQDRAMDAGRVQKAAETLATTKLRGQSTNKGPLADRIYKQAVREVLGEQEINGKIYGGVGYVARDDGWFAAKRPVIAPTDVRQDRLRDIFKAIDNKLLETLPVKLAPGFNAAHLRTALPEAVEGGYRFALKDPDSRDDPQWIRDAAGGIFVLPWHLVRGALREKVPGAFLGGP